MGASNGYLYSVIVKQAAMSAVLGYAVGMCLTFVILYMVRNGEAAILVPWQMVAAMFVLTLAMCVCASLVSIKKLTSIDPAMVFK
jgi:putative ABC transport system permease protein